MTISSQIIDALNVLCAKFGLVIDWTADNVMPYVQELAGKYINWELATSKAWLIVGIILAVISVILIVSDAITQWSDDFAIPFGIILIVIALAIIECQITDILTCTYFPEKQIFEYVNKLIKSAQPHL